MKTCEEKLQRVLQRVETEQAAAKQRRTAVKRAAVPALCLCLAAIIGLGAWQAGAFRSAPIRTESDTAGFPVPEPGGTIQREPAPEVWPEQTILHPGDAGYVAPIPTPVPDTDDRGEKTDTDAAVVPVTEDQLAPAAAETGTASTQTDIVTGGDSTVPVNNGGTKGDAPAGTQYFCLFWWRNKLMMTGDLYWAIDENPSGAFSVRAVFHPVTGNVTSFTYEGKTLAELALAAEAEKYLPDKMTELLKLGDELKYGTALYETGTPDGIRWDQAFYEEKVAYFGEALLNKYIVDGVFLRDALEADIAALTYISVTTPDGTTTTTAYGETGARTLYALAYAAYLETVLPAAAAQLSAAGIPCERAPYRNDALIFTATAQQLESLPLDDPASWEFSLNQAGLKSGS